MGTTLAHAVNAGAWRIGNREAIDQVPLAVTKRVEWQRIELAVRHKHHVLEAFKTAQWLDQFGVEFTQVFLGGLQADALNAGRLFAPKESLDN